MYHDYVARRYELKRRAQQQEETRQRIIDAAISLHGTIGMTRTTVTRVAELAGVGRQTVYRHFPDELALGKACSGLYFERNPLPDPEPWRAIEDPYGRMRTGLSESYAYHRRTEAMLSRVLPELIGHPIVQPYHDHWRQAADVIASAWRATEPGRTVLQAAIGHAIVFTTWQSLVRGQGLTDQEAVELMLRLP